LLKPVLQMWTMRSKPQGTPMKKVWRKMAPKERAKYVSAIARMIQERARELAIIESLDGGKPIP